MGGGSIGSHQRGQGSSHLQGCKADRGRHHGIEEARWPDKPPLLMQKGRVMWLGRQKERRETKRVRDEGAKREGVVGQKERE